MQRIRYADGEAEAEQALGQAERPEIVIAAEEGAGRMPQTSVAAVSTRLGRCAAAKSVRRAPQQWLLREKAEQAVHEIVLQKELLVDGPENVAGDVFEIGFVERMQRPEFCSDERAQHGKRDGGGQDPERWDEAAPAQAQFVAALAAYKDYQQGEQQGRSERECAAGAPASR